MLAKLKEVEKEAERLAGKAEKIAETTAKKAKQKAKHVEGIGFLSGWTKDGSKEEAPDRFKFGLSLKSNHQMHHAPKTDQKKQFEIHHSHKSNLHSTLSIDTSDTSHLIDPNSWRAKCNDVFDLLLMVMHGIKHGLEQVFTCGMCFDQYDQKVVVVEEIDEHKSKCRPDTLVFSLLNLLVIFVAGTGYLIAELLFEPLPTYFRVTHFSVEGCSSKHIHYMEYVPAATCLTLSKQSVAVEKLRNPIKDERDRDRFAIPAGPPPKTPSSQVITFTKHYMWGLSYYIDLYAKESCVNEEELPKSIAQTDDMPPLYPQTQVLDECLSPVYWKVRPGVSSKISGSTCLGTSTISDVVGYYDDRECKSLIKALGYNRTHYESTGLAIPFFSRCEYKKSCESCTFNDKLQVYRRKIHVTDACSSKYDSYGAKLPNNGDNGQYTEVQACTDAYICPNKGQFTEGAESEGFDEEQSNQVRTSPSVWIMLACIFACVFYLSF